jgi:hypothetical protein
MRARLATVLTSQMINHAAHHLARTIGVTFQQALLGHDARGSQCVHLVRNSLVNSH